MYNRKIQQVVPDVVMFEMPSIGLDRQSTYISRLCRHIISRIYVDFKYNYSRVYRDTL